MVLRVYMVIFLGLAFHNGLAQSAGSPSQHEDIQHYIHIAHTRTASNPALDHGAESIDYDVFNMVWLGGDLAWSTSEDDLTMKHVDSVFNLVDENTLWALGNHDYADLQRVSAFTGRPAYYAYCKNNITFLVLDTQDSISNIVGQQKDLFLNVMDTISESSHLIILHHKLIWMYGDPVLQPQIPYISNAGLGESPCFSCIHVNNFYGDIYPELLQVEERGVEVICIAGDIGFRTNQFEYLTPEGIQYLASGIESGNPANQVLLFHHDVGGKQLAWEYVLVSELNNSLDFTAPELHSLNISPDTVQAGDSIRIILQMEDGGSGLDEISLEIVNSFGKQTHSVSNHIGEWINLGDHGYSFDMLIADSAAAGLWSLSWISISDSAGNTLFLSGKDSILASFTVEETVGLGIPSSPQLSLYPVPCEGILNIENNPGIVAVEVFNLTGMACRIDNFTGNLIDLTGLPDGMYVLRLSRSDHVCFIRKIVISKGLGP